MSNENGGVRASPAASGHEALPGVRAVERFDDAGIGVSTCLCARNV